MSGSDPRYRAGVLAGLASGRDRRTWPEALAGLGTLRGGRPFSSCVDCPPERHAFYRRTWHAYVNAAGVETPLCIEHARERAAAAKAGA